MHGRYCHAKQFRRAKKRRKTLRNYLGRVIRDIERHLRCHKNIKLSDSAKTLLERSQRIYWQTRQSKDKLYALHAPEVKCISKGKAHKRYEFGGKVGLVTSLKSNWVLSSLAFNENLYDGHSMALNIANAVCNSGKTIKLASVDKGYRGHNADWLVQTVLMPGGLNGRGSRREKLTRSMRRKLKRRNAIEPVIGHLKHDHRMDRCQLKGSRGDKINALCAAMGFNFKKLLAGLKAAPGSAPGSAAGSSAGRWGCAAWAAFWEWLDSAKPTVVAQQRQCVIQMVALVGFIRDDEVIDVKY
jgi:IS5 family transposase